jgi:hypothetical protein
MAMAERPVRGKRGYGRENVTRRLVAWRGCTGPLTRLCAFMQVQKVAGFPAAGTTTGQGRRGHDASRGMIEGMTAGAHRKSHSENDENSTVHRDNNDHGWDGFGEIKSKR